MRTVITGYLFEIRKGNEILFDGYCKKSKGIWKSGISIGNRKTKTTCQFTRIVQIYLPINFANFETKKKKNNRRIAINKIYKAHKMSLRDDNIPLADDDPQGIDFISAFIV